jgi:enoyl-CoA hydratase/carnithine racemase
MRTPLFCFLAFASWRHAMMMFRRGGRIVTARQNGYHLVRCATASSPSPPPQRRFLASGTDHEDPAVKNDNRRVVTTIDATTGIAEVVLNRPDKLNALDIPMFYAIRDALTTLQREQHLRVVILRGNGRSFCAGLDVPSIATSDPFGAPTKLLQREPLESLETAPLPNLDPAKAAETINLAQIVGYGWRRLPVPVLCVIHGHCLGGGLQIALGADIRYSTKDAKLSIMEAAWGLIPDMGATVALRELVRIDVAKELTFTGRIIDGTTAAQLGLVTAVVDDPLAHARTVAKQLVEKSPDALRLAKQLYQTTWVPNMNEQECLQMEMEYQQKLLFTWNQIAASGRKFGVKLPYSIVHHPPNDDDKQPSDGGTNK